MRIVDTHCHLEQPEFEQDLEDILGRAHDAEIAIITSAIHVRDYERTLAIAREHDTVHVALGLDPTESRDQERAGTEIRLNTRELVVILKIMPD